MSGSAGTMIFHTAYRLDPAAKSASGIRPQRMLEAFRALGFDVVEITGRHPERRRQIATVRRWIREGRRFDFVYSENATAPTGLGEPVTAATSLTRDIRFLRFCQRSGIPVGLFYRDIYWRFPIFTDLIPRPLATILRMLHRRDLRGYRRAGITLFVPSIEMGEWIPIVPADRLRELPPGGVLRETPDHPRPRINLLYVGGLGDNYRLHRTIAEISGRSDVQLTICTRHAEWEAKHEEYAPLLGKNIRVVHRSGTELDELYQESDICVIAVEPIRYWSFAVPMKLFEYLGWGKPIIASDHTYPGRFVDENEAGWTLPYGEGALSDLLDRLVSHPEEITAATDRVRRLRHRHTWEERARQVARDLLPEHTQ